MAILHNSSPSSVFVNLCALLTKNHNSTIEIHIFCGSITLCCFEHWYCYVLLKFIRVPEVESLMDCQLFKMRLMQQEPIVAVPPKPSSYDLLLSPRHPSTGCAHGLCMKKTSEFQLILLFCPICEVATYFGLLRYASRATCS